MTHSERGVPDGQDSGKETTLRVNPVVIRNLLGAQIVKTLLAQEVLDLEVLKAVSAAGSTYAELHHVAESIRVSELEAEVAELKTQVRLLSMGSRKSKDA